MTLLCWQQFSHASFGCHSPVIARSFTWTNDEYCGPHFSVPIWTWGSWKMLFIHDLLGSSWHGIGGFTV